MRIVPEDSGFEIQAYVRNRDIGFVSVGQEAVVKVESFPFNRYGAIKARVTRIAKDAIPEPDANAIEGESDARLQRGRLCGRRAHAEFGVPGRAEARRRNDAVDGVAEPLTSGMAVTVELKTGARRMLEYLFAPLVEVASKAMRER
jgi:hemolysin D